MKEKNLLKIALITGFIGVSILFLMSKYLEPQEKLGAGNKDLISGNVVNIIKRNNSAEIIITRTEFLRIVVFDKDNLNFLSLKDGTQIEAIGKLDENDGRKQLIADEIRII